MSSQQRRHRKVRKLALRPAVLVAALAVVLVAAIAGLNVLTSQASASSRAGAAGTTSHGKGGKGGKSAGSSPSASASASGSPSASASTSEASAAGGATSSSSPVAQLPAPASTSASASDSASASASASDTPSDTPSDTAAATPTTGTAPANAESNRVGALFSGGVSAGNHFCTASVVHSATRNLLVTAAHCLSSANGVQFAPGYRNGQTPYGTWQVTQIYTTNGWSQNGDPDQDFAFLQVASNNGRQIEDVVGANTLGTNVSFTAKVRLYGYADTGETPLLCTNSTTQQSSYQRRIDCPSYPAGTSGGPWISTATGAVIGVIGGYQQGGDTDDTSYSAYFDQTIANLYQTAVSSAG